MNASELNRQKYLTLMTDVEGLEETVADLENDIKEASEFPGSEEVKALQEELAGFRRKLAQARTELARVSDGCGRPHPQS